LDEQPEIYYLLLFVPALRCGKPVWSPLESKVRHPCLASGLSSRFSASLVRVREGWDYEMSNQIKFIGKTH